MEEPQKIGKKLDKLVMGIILGGAIGSVLGLTLAPRKGKEMRKLIKEKGQEFVRDHKEVIKSAKYQIKKGKGFFRWLLSKWKKQPKMPNVSMDEEE